MGETSGTKIKKERIGITEDVLLLLYAVLLLIRASYYIVLLLFKYLGTSKFILHPKAAVNPLTAYQVIKLV